jgi:hypothetical protein
MVVSNQTGQRPNSDENLRQFVAAPCTSSKNSVVFQVQFNFIELKILVLGKKPDLIEAS